MRTIPRKPKQLNSDDLELVANAWGVLLYAASMLRDIEHGNMPARFDLINLAEVAESIADQLDAILPDDPDQLALIA